MTPDRRAPHVAFSSWIETEDDEFETQYAPSCPSCRGADNERSKEPSSADSLVKQSSARTAEHGKRASIKFE